MRRPAGTGEARTTRSGSARAVHAETTSLRPTRSAIAIELGRCSTRAAALLRARAGDFEQVRREELG